MEKRLTPIKAIRAKCLDCMGGSSKEVKRCNIPECSLYFYRLGKNPARVKRKGGIDKEIHHFAKNSIVERPFS
jgi:hypothetical protein